jgi:hypothetical protein
VLANVYVVQAFRSPAHKRAAAAVALYGAIVAVVLGIVTTPVAGIVVAAAAALLASRNYRAGLFVNDDAVVARNLTHTWRVPVADVADVTMMSPATDTSRRPSVWVIAADGSCHRVAALRGNPLRGEALAAAIRDAVAGALSRGAR